MIVWILALLAAAAAGQGGEGDEVFGIGSLVAGLLIGIALFWDLTSIDPLSLLLGIPASIFSALGPPPPPNTMGGQFGSRVSPDALRFLFLLTGIVTLAVAAFVALCRGIRFRAVDADPPFIGRVLGILSSSASFLSSVATIVSFYEKHRPF